MAPTKRTPTLDDGTLQSARALARLLRQNDLSEVEIERGDLRIRVARQINVATSVQSVVEHVEATSHVAVTPTPSTDGARITSPFVGTFYRAPGPDQAPFVEVGQAVRRGQTLCIVEAMKLMNEIEAEADCTIVDVLVGNGDVVQYGQPLFAVRLG